MSPRETLLAVASLLNSRGHRAALRYRIFDVDGEIAAHLTSAGIQIPRVRNHDGACLMASRMVRAHETAEDIARDMEARARLVAAVEVARRASLTPEQRELEDRPVCVCCGLRDPMPGQGRCSVCQKAA